MNKKSLRRNMTNRSGFTLIEVVVVAAIIAILAGILVPMIFNQIDEAKKSRALGECKTISTAVLLFRKDTGKWPLYVPSDCTTMYLTLESGTGNVPLNLSGDWQAGSGASAGIFGTIFNLPSGAAQTCYNKAGSYFPEDKADPWGYKYIVNAINFSDDTLPVWVISAGPNGCLETSVNGQTLNDGAACVSGQPADDIGIRIK